MCSPSSPALADYRGALLTAAADVAENSLFAFADASTEDVFDAAATAPIAEGGGDWLRAVVDFKGPIAGRLELAAPVGLARHLCASFAGADPDGIGDSDLLDFTGEVANMVCGTWLTRACRHDAFSLSPPRVDRGQPDRGRADDLSERFYLSLDDTPIRLQLHWERADGR